MNKKVVGHKTNNGGNQEKMNLKFLLILWINYDCGMSDEDTRQERERIS